MSFSFIVRRPTGEGSYMIADLGCEVPDGELRDLAPCGSEVLASSASLHDAIDGEELVRVRDGEDVSKERAFDDLEAVRGAAVDGRGRMSVAQFLPAGSKTWQISQSFSAKVCWWWKSVGVENEVLTDSGNHQTYEAAHGYIVDLSHRRMSCEDTIPTDYASTHPWLIPVVKVNDVEQPSGYGIDYAAGTVTFDSPLQPTDAVTMSYRYATTSQYSLIAQNGAAPKRLVIVDAEFQWTQDIAWPEGEKIQVTVRGYVPHPAIPGVMVGPIDLRVYAYRTLMDLLEEARTVYPSVPSHGGDCGIPEAAVAWHDVRWEYMTETILYPAAWASEHYAPDYGESFWITEFEIRLATDQPMGGTRCSCTFYCRSEELS